LGVGIMSKKYIDRGYSKLVLLLEDSIDLVDKIETFIGRINPMEQVRPGILTQIYESLVILREKLVEARMEAYRYDKLLGK
jgi:hypothetical protein